MRSSTQYAFEKLGLMENVAEIGVRDGRNAEEILKVCKYIYLIDSYQPYFDGKLITADEQGIYKKAMLYRMAPYGERVNIINAKSTMATHLFSNGFFDYVYIDGSHNYPDVMADLIGWYPKVKQGGVLAGHDFDKVHNGVTKAVIKFAELNGLTVENREQDGIDWYENVTLSDWWIDKL